MAELFTATLFTIPGIGGVTVGSALTAVGTIAGVAGAVQQGKAAQSAGRAQQQAADYNARVLEQQAGQERASSQRRAQAEQKQKTLVASRAQAVAAASGAGALDPTVTDVIGDIESEGELRALTALYEGEERARGLEARAQGAQYEGRVAGYTGDLARRSSLFKAGGTLLSGASRFGLKSSPSDALSGGAGNTILESGAGNDLLLKYG